MIKIFLLFSFVSLNVYSKSFLFDCENGFSYKISQTNNGLYKSKDKNWKKIDKIIILKNEYELFIPNSNYLSCSNKDLPICSYSKLINFNIEKNKANVREIVLNDCFIGTMGCNKYSKGLELNQKRCKISN